MKDDDRMDQKRTRKLPRRTQEDRSSEARARLLDATIAVLTRRGYSGLTTKEVAKCAGLSNGALVHHFSTKEELVVAATASVYETAIQRGQRVARTPEATKRPLSGFITDCLSVYFDWPFIVALEVILVARTDDRLMTRILPVMEHYRNTINEIWLQVFKASGMSTSQSIRVLNLTLNLVRGMAVHRLWKKDDKYFKKYLKEWEELINLHLKASGNI